MRPPADETRRSLSWAPAAVLLVLGGAWELAGRFWESLLFPTATATGVALARLLASPEFWEALWISNQAFILGFALALAAGIGGGLALARWPRLDRWLDAYVGVLFVAPKSAVMPLVVIALGFGLFSRSILVFSFAFPTIVVTVRAGARGVDRALVAMARSFGATEAQIWRRVLVPGALPAIMTAARLGIAQALGGMVTAELLLISVGIGRMIASFQADFDAASLYAVVLVVVVEAVLVVRLAGALERRFGSWPGSGAIE